jgi:L-cystine transport system permease protein
MIDMMGQGNLIITRNYGSYALETYLALALVYWAMTVLIERGFLTLETRLSRGKRAIGAAEPAAAKKFAGTGGGNVA